MAFRKIHDNFWTDPDVEEMTPEQKYFYLYLLTNPSVNQLGLYELTIRRASFETGYSMDSVSILFQYFIDTGKIIVSDKTNEILVVKFYHYNKSNSPKLQAHINQLLRQVKDKVLIQYIYSMNTASQKEEEEEQEIEVEKNEVIKIKKPISRFAPPTVDELKEHFISKGSTEIESLKFYEFYGSKGWMVGKNKMKDWKLAASGWIRRNNTPTTPQTQQASLYE